MKGFIMFDDTHDVKLIMLNASNTVIAREIESNYPVAFHPFPYAKAIQILDMAIGVHSQSTESNYFESNEYIEKILVMKIEPKY